MFCLVFTRSGVSCVAGKNKGIFTEPVLQELIAMVKINLFRALPPKQRDNTGGRLLIKSKSEQLIRCVVVGCAVPKEPTNTGSGQQGAAGESDEEDPIYEASWPHLQIVYEFFLRFIVSSEVDIRTLKKYINGLLQLLYLLIVLIVDCCCCGLQASSC